MPGRKQPLAHRPAHLAKTDEADRFAHCWLIVRKAG
jgi:hypothetical protein